MQSSAVRSPAVTVRVLTVALLTGTFAAAAAVAYWTAVGVIPSPPFSRGLGLAALSSGRFLWDVPLEFFAFAWFVGILLAYSLDARWYDGHAQSAIDEVIFYSIVLAAAGCGGLVWADSSRSWLLIVPLLIAPVVLAVTARAFKARGSATTILAFPGLIIVFIVVATSAYFSAREIATRVRAGKGDAAYRRLLPEWLGTLSRLADPALVPVSGVRVVVFVDERPVGSSDFEAYRAVVSAHQKIGAPIEWVELVVPRDGVCESDRAYEACRPALALALFARTGSRRAARLLRDGLSKGTQEPRKLVDVLAAGRVRDGLAGPTESLRLELLRNERLAARLRLESIPAMFVNGIRLRGLTPDLFDGIVGHLLTEGVGGGRHRQKRTWR
jgi:hypothetical protein